jgi:hypothetical protein
VQNATLKTPQARFNRTSISLATAEDVDVSDTFTIINRLANGIAGQCPLDYSITTADAWVMTDPVSGTVDPGDTVVVTVLLDAEGFAFGSQNTSLITVEHEAADSPTIIEVELNISLDADDPGAVPTEYALYQNYPNPFNATTSLRFDVPQESVVKVVLFNVMGQAVATVADGVYSAGRHQVNYDATDLPSGMYLMRMQAGSYSSMKKMLLLK